MLHEDRFFSPEPSVRAVARELFAEVRGLPLICPHGHVEPRLLAENAPLPEPTALLITPDHYIVRMLYSRGVPMSSLGLPNHGQVGTALDAREVWQLFADNSHLFRATPTGAWLKYELHDLFGIARALDGGTAKAIYDEISEKLRGPDFLPRALYERFGIEVLATTDGATDSLEHHRRIRDSGWKGRVIPTFRPDSLFRIADPGWPAALRELATACGQEIVDYGGFTSALEERRRFFASMGATATDHAVREPRAAWLGKAEIERVFQLALRGEATPAEQIAFEGHMLMEMARMSTEDGLVMQLHPGAFRDHNQPIRERFGSDVGADIPTATEYTRNLRPLLNQFGNHPRLKLVLFTLDESTYSRELAPLAGHYPAVRLGSPWWFHDSVEGIRRFLEQVTETAGIYNTAGFADDTRAFCSIPARHDLARRVLADWLAHLTTRHIVDLSEARQMARAYAYDLPKEVYER